MAGCRPPKEWGLDMTLCLGAVAADRKIILATDGMLSIGDYMSIDTRTMKIMPLSNSWHYWVAFAGNPTYAEAFSRRAGKMVDATDFSFEAVTQSCAVAFQQIRQNAIEAEVLSPYKLTIDAFVCGGLGHFGEQKFGELTEQMEAVKLATDFLIGGHDSAGRPHLFSVSDPGTVTSHQMPGFHAIGSGAWSAIGAMYSTREHRSDMSWIELSYRVLEAKFRGESAMGVGKITNAMLLIPDQHPRVIQNAPCTQVREIWNDKGRPPMPRDAGLVIENRFVEYPFRKPD